jgi:hypothetical protein
MSAQRQKQKSKTKGENKERSSETENQDKTESGGETDTVIMAIVEEYVEERPGLAVEDIDERDINAIMREISAREPALSYDHGDLFRKVDISLRRRLRENA